MSFNFATLIFTKPTATPHVAAPVSNRVVQETRTSPTSLLPTFNARFDSEWVLELWRERAAIMCIDGEVAAEDACEMAWTDVWSAVRHYRGAPKAIDFMPSGAGCYHCGCRHLVDVPDSGLECLSCGTMAWVVISTSIVRGDYLGEFE